ncbi:sulfotransferase family protein [Parasphingorhabdus sp.]|uniref:sulfotransferase family protein n=1 Tax=Parasphingorhabdus sp. TaxID=2709688 RepID=UPI003001135D
MALKVIGAGPGRTATFSTKFALEHIGYGPCYHMVEVFRNARRNIPLWQNVVDGKPDWDAIFDGYSSVTDNPACVYWRELAEFYPEAKVVLTVRDADAWVESCNDTINSPRMLSSLEGSDLLQMLQGTYLSQFGENIDDREWMANWYRAFNAEVIDTIPSNRLLVFHPKDGWEPLCDFLEVPVPSEPFPRVNSRDELGGASDEQGGLPADPEQLEAFAGGYIDELRRKAFA